jgi:hypothetical protein
VSSPRAARSRSAGVGSLRARSMAGGSSRCAARAARETTRPVCSGAGERWHARSRRSARPCCARAPTLRCANWRSARSPARPSQRRASRRRGTVPARRRCSTCSRPTGGGRCEPRWPRILPARPRPPSRLPVTRRSGSAVPSQSRAMSTRRCSRSSQQTKTSGCEMPSRSTRSAHQSSWPASPPTTSSRSDARSPSGVTPRLWCSRRSQVTTSTGSASSWRAIRRRRLSCVVSSSTIRGQASALSPSTPPARPPRGSEAQWASSTILTIIITVATTRYPRSTNIPILRLADHSIAGS